MEQASWDTHDRGLGSTSKPGHVRKTCFVAQGFCSDLLACHRIKNTSKESNVCTSLISEAPFSDECDEGPVFHYNTWISFSLPALGNGPMRVRMVGKLSWPCTPVNGYAQPRVGRGRVRIGRASCTQSYGGGLVCANLRRRQPSNGPATSSWVVRRSSVRQLSECDWWLLSLAR